MENKVINTRYTLSLYSCWPEKCYYNLDFWKSDCTQSATHKIFHLFSSSKDWHNSVSFLPLIVKQVTSLTLMQVVKISTIACLSITCKESVIPRRVYYYEIFRHGIVNSIFLWKKYRGKISNIVSIKWGRWSTSNLRLVQFPRHINFMVYQKCRSRCIISKMGEN